MKPSHLLIPLVTVAVSLIGQSFTSSGLSGWYKTLTLPSWTPPGSVIGIVWTTIFVLATVSALLLWNTPAAKGRLPVLAAAFLANAALNVLWSWLFFVQHRIVLAGWEAVLLDVSVLILIVLAWPLSRLAAALLVPYAAWVAFAAYLTFTVARLNR
jgi:benzodiazapine receptor